MQDDVAVEGRNIVLSKEEAVQVMRALDTARDAIQCISVGQLKLYHINPQTDQMLDAAMDILGPLLGMKKGPV